MAVAGVDPQTLDPGLPDQRGAGGTNRPEARPKPRLVNVEMALQLGEGETGIVDDRLKPRASGCRIIAGDLGRAGNPHPVANWHQTVQPAVVDHWQRRRPAP